MSLSPIFASITGLDAASKRLAASSANIANMRDAADLGAAESEAARQAQAGRGVQTASRFTGYKPFDVHQETLQGAGVRAEFREREDFFVPAFDSGNPVADADGMVAMPNVDLAEEAVSLKLAKLAHSASLAVIRTENSMFGELLDERV